MEKPPHPGHVEVYHENDGKRWLAYTITVQDPPEEMYYVQLGARYIPIVKIVAVLDRDGFTDVEIDYGPGGEELRVIHAARSNCPK